VAHREARAHGVERVHEALPDRAGDAAAQHALPRRHLGVVGHDAVLDPVVERELDGRLGGDLQRVGAVAFKVGADAALGRHHAQALPQREVARLLHLQQHLEPVDRRGRGAADGAGEAAGEDELGGAEAAVGRRFGLLLLLLLLLPPGRARWSWLLVLLLLLKLLL
jgi:hypothetical protein